MRYIVIGAGAVGGVIGGLLHESGQDVVLVARGAHAEALRSQGLTLVTPARTTVHRVPVVDRPDALQVHPDDVLVLAVKTQDTVAALDAWADQPVSGGGTASGRIPVVCAQNGVENERCALRRFARVYAMCVVLPATHLSPGVAVAPCTPFAGAAVLGRYPSGMDATTKLMADDLARAGLHAVGDPAVMAWKYAKLVNNLPNAVEALVHPDDAALARELVENALTEAAAVLDAAGVRRVSDAELAGFRAGRVEPQVIEGYEHGSSTWQSLTRAAGSVETDYLNGEIVLLGRQHGVPTPVNEAIQRAARSFALEKRAPLSLRAAELAASVRELVRTSHDGGDG